MPRAGLSPDAVARAAARVADAHGLDHVRPSTVAEEAGVRTPSLYAHVDGADDLRRRLTLLARSEQAGAGEAAVEGRSGADALRAHAEALRAYAIAHPGRYAAARRAVDPDTAAGSAGPRVAATLLSVVDDYGLPADERVHAVRVVSGAVHGFVQLQQSGAFDHSDPPPDASWDRLLDGLDALLTHWPR